MPRHVGGALDHVRGNGQQLIVQDTANLGVLGQFIAEFVAEATASRVHAYPSVFGAGLRQRSTIVWATRKRALSDFSNLASMSEIAGAPIINGMP